MSSARLRSAKLVVLRMLGGESYWPHGVESLRADALRRGVLFACLPGELSCDRHAGRRAARLTKHDTHELWRYCARAAWTTSHRFCDLPLT